MLPRSHRCCLILLASSLGAASADVSFTPGPGLKKNPDGSYSRTYDAQAEGAAAGAGGGDGLPPWQNALLVAAAAAAFYCYSSGHMPQLPRMQRAARPPPKASAGDVDEARVARLARFTGDGPTTNQKAFEAALGGGVATAAAPRPAAPASRVATLGTIAARDGADDPDEFFGGDSTSQYK